MIHHRPKLYQHVVVLAILFFTLHTSIFAQKAYDAVYYAGKLKTMTIKFTLANGYIGASEIKTTDLRTKHVSKFLPGNAEINEDKTMKFVHSSSPTKQLEDYFIVDGLEDGFADAPKTFHAKYYLQGKMYEVELARK